MDINDTKNAQKSDKIFYCNICDCSFSKKCDLNRHFLTMKHKKIQNDTKGIKNAQNAHRPFKCSYCNRSYKYHSGLWRHMKTCEYASKQLVVKEDETEYKEIIDQQMKIIQNQQEMLAETIPKIGNTTNNIENTINDNRTINNVNINLFLNGDCQNAMTIDSFVEQLKLGMHELNRTGELGFVNGMIEIFKDSLEKLETTERPIHCTDAKRCTMYVKNEAGWEKDVDSATTKKMVKAVKKKNCSNLDEWADNHPGSREGKDPHGQEYIDLVTEATGGDIIDGHEINTNMNKIVKGIAKTVKLNVDNSGNMVEE